MGQPVAEAVGGSAALARLLAPSPGRLEFSLRLALICTLSTLLTMRYQTPEPALTAYIAFFVAKPDRMASIATSVAVTLLVTILLAFVLTIAVHLVDRPAWRLASMALLSFGLMFLASASKLKPLGGTLALIVIYALALLGTVPTGELATRGLLYAWLFVGIPAGVSLVVNLVLGPPPRRLLQHALAARVRGAAAALRDERAGPSALEGDEGLLALLEMTAREHASRSEDVAALRRALLSSGAIASIARFMREIDGAWPHAAAREHAACTLDEMAAILDAGGYPVRIEPAVPGPPLAGLAADADAALRSAIARFAEARPARADAASGADEAHAGFLRPDALGNPEHVRHALKTTAAAMGCYLLYSLLDWPGIHTCLITCYIVSMSTLAESVEKLALRLAGCAIGSALGLAVMIFVVPSYTGIGALLAIVFLGAAAAAWVAGGSPRVAYAGFQLAFAFFLCVIQGPEPSFDMVVARDRVVGIVVGNLAMYAVTALCWPLSLSRRIESGLADARRLLGRWGQAADRDARLELGARLRGAIVTLREELDLVRYEPGSVRPNARWIDEGRGTTERIEALATVLQIVAEGDDVVDAALANRLAGLAEPPAFAPAAPVVDEALAGIIDARLRAVESEPASTPMSTGAAHAPA